MNLYKTLVQPILDYGAAVWNPYQKEDIQKNRKSTKKSNPYDTTNKKTTIWRETKKMQFNVIGIKKTQIRPNRGIQINEKYI